MTATREEILTLEELALNAHPPLQTRLYYGWLLHFSRGYTKRTNSVHPLYHREGGASGDPGLEDRVLFCGEQYRSSGLPPVFKLTPASPEGLDALLEGKGYVRIDPTTVMTLPLERLPEAEPDPGVTLEGSLSGQWMDSMFQLNGVPSPHRETAAAILSNTRPPLIFGSIGEEGAVTACGLCVLERGYAGLYEIVVDAGRRGQGLGYRLCLSLLHRARELGAHTGYLQVVSANGPARALYKKLGFGERYGYWYRRGE